MSVFCGVLETETNFHMPSLWASTSKVTKVCRQNNTIRHELQKNWFIKCIF